MIDNNDKIANFDEEWANFGFDFHYPLVSRSPKMKEIFALVKKIAKSNSTVLIQGETGTGKELIASLIQFISSRSSKSFVKVNCAALPENLLESELFGHERGAFTGAYQTRIGKFEEANSGTIFLDEIGDMHLSTQSKILRVLQEQEFARVGGNHPIKVDVRVIAASNKDLFQEIERGNFRPDLYYRINVVNIHLPALRERREDIPLIAEFFRRKFCEELRKKILGFTDEALELLRNHYWSGNIRELRNMIERAVLVAEENQMITPPNLAMQGRDYFAAGGIERRLSEVSVLHLNTLNLEEVERSAILKALQISNWIQKDAARLLGISPRVLNYKISQYNIIHKSWRRHT